jgi:hypothetical protein
MLLPFHKVYPMQLLGTKDVPDGKSDQLVSITGRKKEITMFFSVLEVNLYLICS